MTDTDDLSGPWPKFCPCCMSEFHADGSVTCSDLAGQAISRLHRAVIHRLQDRLRRVDEIRAAHRALSKDASIEEIAQVLVPFPAARDALEDELRAWLATIGEPAP